MLRKGNLHLESLKEAIEHDIDYFVVLQSHTMSESYESSLDTMINLALDRQDSFRRGIRFLIPVKIEECPVLESLEHLRTIDVAHTFDELLTTMRRDQQKRLKGR